MITVETCAYVALFFLLLGAGLIYWAARREWRKSRELGYDNSIERAITVFGVLCLFMSAIFAFAADARADDARISKPLAPSEREQLEYHVRAFEQIVAICSEGCVVKIANDGQTLAFLRLEVWKRLNPPRCAPMKSAAYQAQLLQERDEIARSALRELMGTER